MTLWGGVPTYCHNDVILGKIVWRRPLSGLARAVYMFEKLLSAVCYNTSAFTAMTTILSAVFTAPM